MPTERRSLRGQLLRLMEEGRAHGRGAGSSPGGSAASVPIPVEPRRPRGNQVIEKATITAEQVYGGGSYVLPDPLEDVTLRRSRFEMWQHHVQRTLEERPTLRRLHIERCHFTASDLGPLVVEDSVLDTIWLHRGKWGPQHIGGSVFRHVIVRGRITEEWLAAAVARPA